MESGYDAVSRMALLAELRELYLGKVDMLQEMEQITAEQQMQSGTDSQELSASATMSPATTFAKCPLKVGKFRPDSTLE